MSRMATHGTRVDATFSVRSRYRKAHTRLSTSLRTPTPRSGNLYVVVTSSNYCKVQVEYNDSIVGTLQTSNSNNSYIYGCESRGTYRVPAVEGHGRR